MQKIVRPLLEWYEIHGRILPWRSDPSPYHVWVSEIMLQQTRVEAVKEYYRRFVGELFGIKELSLVDEDKLLKLWEGLGYYSRARNLKKGAIMVMNEFGGELPEEYEQLLTIPGIGPYTAGAISSIAFGRPEVAIDGNVLRVVMRLLGKHSNIAEQKVKREVEGLVKEIIPVSDAGGFNQAIMDLGAMVCIPNGMPKCESCPLQFNCNAYKKGIVSQIPVKSKKKSRKIQNKTVFLFECDGKYAIRKREDKGLLASMWEFPNVDERMEPQSVWEFLEHNECGLHEMELLGEGKHIFSHVEWDMVGYKIHLKEYVLMADKSGLCPEKWTWKTKEEIEEEYSIPAAFKIFYRMII